MRLTPATNKGNVSAYVTLTSGDACDDYFNRYPNGIEFGFSGKKYVAFVERGETVDVMSGMMQGYLDCAASRVVKVSGVDDDWGIVALNKMAEGKNQIRQVESIIDTYHNRVSLTYPCGPD
jgi:hypothetical protein